MTSDCNKLLALGRQAASALLFGLACLGAASAWSEDDDASMARERARYERSTRLPAGMAELPMERYLEARKRMDSMPRYLAGSGRLIPGQSGPTIADARNQFGCDWEELGPGNIGGRVRAIAIDPADSRVLYAAGVAGGVMKSTDHGANWSAVGDLMANMAVCALVIDPADHNTLYAGTGEGYPSNDGRRGLGIFVSKDAGQNWSRLASTAGPDFYYVYKIAFSPNHPGRIYAATGTGLWASPDSGLSWAKLFAASRGGCLDLVVDSSGGKDRAAGVFGDLDYGTGIYACPAADTGGAWSLAYSVSTSSSASGRIVLAQAPSSRSTVYAMVNDMYSENLYALIRSTDGGATWSERYHQGGGDAMGDHLLGSSDSICPGRTGGAQPAYCMALAVDPLDPTKVWAASMDVFRSDDAGAHWHVVNLRDIHRDQHTIVFDPGFDGAANKAVYIGNDGGVWRIDDARGPVMPDVCVDAGFSPVVNLNHGLNLSQFYHGLPFPGGQSYLGGLQDNGTAYGTDATGINGWVQPGNWDGGFVAIDPTDPNTVYWENQFLALYKGTRSGASFTGVSAVTGISESAYNFSFITAFSMDATNPKVLWIAGLSPWRSVNGAQSWARAGAAFGTSTYGPDERATAIAGHPRDGNRVMLGTVQGKILHNTAALSAGGATAWPSSIPQPGARVSSIAFDPVDLNTAYATFSTFGFKHLMKSADFGVTWSALDGSGPTSLPDIPLWCVAPDPKVPGRIFVGSDLGIFVSLDSGANWAVVLGHPYAPAQWLAFDGNTIFSFTHGRSAWRSCLGASPSPTPSLSPSPTPSATATPSVSSSPTLSPAFTATPSASFQPSASPTASAEPTATGTSAASQTPLLSPSPSASQSATLTGTQSATPAPSATPSRSASKTPFSTATATPMPSLSATPRASSSPSKTPSATAASTAAATATPAGGAAQAGEFLERVSVVPNPNAGRAMLSYDLSKPAAFVRLRVYSVNFALIQSVERLPSKQAKGLSLPLAFVSSEGTPLASGLVYLVLEARAEDGESARVLRKLYIRK